MEMQQLFVQFSLLLLLLFLVHLDTTVSQSPTAAPTISPPAPVVPQTPAPAPGPAGPTNITAILEKVGHFNTLIRLLKSTETADRINDQLNNSRGGLTIFAPTDSAFSNLKNKSLNTLSSQQQAELVQFHILPTYFSLSQFETASDPLSTQAGGTNYGQFPLNVTATGNSVNLTTGFSNSSISSTVYTDGQLAVYEVDHVLLPQKFFITPPPVPAPAPAPPKHKAAAKSDDSSPVNTSKGIRLCQKLYEGYYLVAVLAVYLLGL